MKPAPVAPPPAPPDWPGLCGLMLLLPAPPSVPPPGCRPPAGALGAGLHRAAAGALLGGRQRGVGQHHRAQGLRQLGGVGVFQVDHVDVAGFRSRLVELGDQRLGQVGARRRGRAHHHRIGARVGQHRDAAGVAARGRLHQAADHGGDVGGDGVAHRHHVEVGADRRVERGDDLRQPAQVVGVVGDHQAVVARVGHDRIVGRNQRTQHGGQVGGRFVAKVKTWVAIWSPLPLAPPPPTWVGERLHLASASGTTLA